MMLLVLFLHFAFNLHSSPAMMRWPLHPLLGWVNRWSTPSSHQQPTVRHHARLYAVGAWRTRTIITILCKSGVKEAHPLVVQSLHQVPLTYPWRWRLLLVVHFFHTSMFFLMVPSPLHHTERTAVTVRQISPFRPNTNSLKSWGKTICQKWTD